MFRDRTYVCLFRDRTYVFFLFRDRTFVCLFTDRTYVCIFRGRIFSIFKGSMGTPGMTKPKKWKFSGIQVVRRANQQKIKI